MDFPLVDQTTLVFVYEFDRVFNGQDVGVFVFIPDSFPALDLEHFDCKTDSVGKLGVIDDFFNFLFRKILKLSEKDLI